MSKTKRTNLTFSRNRVVLSDVLPYEVPPIFSNRFFYRFLNNYSVKFVPSEIGTDFGRLEWKKQFLNSREEKTFEMVMKLLFHSNNMNDTAGYVKETSNSFYLKINEKHFSKIPFSFDIAHKEHELRTLSIPHIFNQVQLVSFYEKYKDLIIYYSEKSKFSLRKPKAVAKNYFFRDKMHSQKMSKDEAFSIEEFEKEYETLRSFFTYEKYSNVFKFFESHPYHRAEKKYGQLLKLDISKCFDSLYTHSISWALLGKHGVKKQINKSRSFFSGQFDALMQNLNFNETNGVIIGPEFSRIFAELILQKIDLNLSNELAENSIRKGVDYEIYRYVDDYFIFFNETKHKEAIIKFLQLQLKEYKLSLNNEKLVLYTSPIITETTIAKNKISNLMNKNKFTVDEVGDSLGGTEIKGYLSIEASKLIVEFKTILKESGANYKDVLNYSLASLESKIESLLETYILISNKNEKSIINALIELVEFMFFVYSSAQRVSYTIKLSRILQKVIIFSNKNFKNKDLKHHLFKSISDNINLVLRNNRYDKHIHVETLYLLITLSELGRTYKLTEKNLADYFGFEKVESNEKYRVNERLRYFSIVCILFYIKDYKDYSGIKEAIEKTIQFKLQDIDDYYRPMSTELTLLLFDSISCPYISKEKKVKFLNNYKVSDKKLKEDIIEFCMKEKWFIKWTDFNLMKELESKKSLEVY